MTLKGRPWSTGLLACTIMGSMLQSQGAGNFRIQRGPISSRRKDWHSAANQALVSSSRRDGFPGILSVGMVPKRAFVTDDAEVSDDWIAPCWRQIKRKSATF
jgi:hypothetical protein